MTAKVCLGTELVAVNSDNRELVVCLSAGQMSSLMGAIAEVSGAPVDLPETVAAVGAARATAVCSVELAGRDLVSFELANTGANPLTGCLVQKRYSSNGPWRPFLGDEDFTNAANPNLEFVSAASGVPITPHNLAAGANSQFSVWVSGATAVRLVLTSTLGTTVRVGGNAVKG